MRDKKSIRKEVEDRLNRQWKIDCECLAKHGNAVERIKDAIVGEIEETGLSAEEMRYRNIEAHISRILIETINSLTAKHDLNVALFLPDKSYRSFYGQIDTYLKQKGIGVFYFFGAFAGSDAEKHDTSFLINARLFDQLEGIDVYLAPTYLDCLPKNVTRILIDHLSYVTFTPPPLDDVEKQSDCITTFEDAVLRYGYARAFTPLFDYYFAPSKHIFGKMVQRLKFMGYFEEGMADGKQELGKAAQIFYSRLDEGHVAKKIHLVKGGYPKLDKNIQSAREASVRLDTITYAPTPNSPESNKGSWLPFMTVNDHAASILEQLAKNFPEYRIAFKPFADELESALEPTREIIERYENLYLDISGSNYAELYARTAVLLSDFSSTAYSFSFITSRPVNFLSFNERLLKNWPDPYLEKRTRFGMVSEDLEQMVENTRRLLENPEEIKADIQQAGLEEMYNLGSASRAIADAIEAIGQGRPVLNSKAYLPDVDMVGTSED